MRLLSSVSNLLHVSKVVLLDSKMCFLHGDLVEVELHSYVFSYQIMHIVYICFIQIICSSKQNNDLDTIIIKVHFHFSDFPTKQKN